MTRGLFCSVEGLLSSNPLYTKSGISTGMGSVPFRDSTKELISGSSRQGRAGLSVRNPGGVGERLKPPDCKSGLRKEFVGSNPTPSTNLTTGELISG